MNTRDAAMIGLQRMTWRWMETVSSVSRSVHSGLWLGLMSRAQIHALDAVSREAPNIHLTGAYNRGGLTPWESAAIDTYFGQCRTVVVLGAGAGRECAALLARGLEIDGFECNTALRHAGASIFGASFAGRCLQPMEFDTCPPLTGPYDGFVVGWGMYTHIQGRARRVRLLQDLRAKAVSDAPLLLSFFVRGGSHRSFRLGVAIAGALRRLAGREPVEYGDAISPTYAHYFGREELEAELREGGWEPLMFDHRTYPHAVAAARP